MTYYQRVYCYRVRESQREQVVAAEAVSAGGHVEYRRDCIDVYIPEGTGLTQFLLAWSDHLMHLDYLDFYRASCDQATGT
jgi:5-enolpyruvylshikimate-3-phosphate synthase